MLTSESLKKDTAVLKNQDCKKWGERLEGIVAMFENTFIKTLGETDAEKAKEQAMILTVELANYWGGKSIYLPKGEKVRIALRNSHIFREFNGANMPELVKKYRLSESTIYHILREQRRLQKIRNDKKFN